MKTENEERSSSLFCGLFNQVWGQWVKAVTVDHDKNEAAWDLKLSSGEKLRLSYEEFCRSMRGPKVLASVLGPKMDKLFPPDTEVGEDEIEDLE